MPRMIQNKVAISLLLSMIMHAYIKEDHGKTEHIGLTHQQEDSLTRRVHVMISDSDAQ